MNPYTIANVVDAYDDKMATVKVPVHLDGAIPDIPRVISKNGWLAYLHKTNPLTYTWIDSPVEVEIIDAVEGAFCEDRSTI